MNLDPQPTQTYVVQPGHVVNVTGGQQLQAGATLDLTDDEAAELGAAVALQQ